MSSDDNPPVTRFDFQIGEAFPPDDRTARYAMRLSLALGDLRIAVDYAVRQDQRDYERLYFIRLTMQHLRELAFVLDPTDRTVVPSVEEFISEAIPDSRPEWRTRLRELHQDVLTLLSARFDARDATLHSELRRLRNGFAHYHRDARSDAELRAAMERASAADSSYIVGPDVFRARYADDVAANLVHPFPADRVEEFARELHARTAELIVGPLGDFLQHVESYYLQSRPPGVVRFSQGESSESGA